MTVTHIDEAELPFIDIHGQAYARNRQATVGEARERSWVARSDTGVHILDYDVIREMVRDKRLDGAGAGFFESKGGSPMLVEYSRDGMLPLIQGARHDRIRRVLQRGFGAGRIKEMRTVMRRVAEELVDRIAPDGRFDMTGDFSHWYPLRVLCALIGVPEKDVERFSHWTVALGLVGRTPLEPHLGTIDDALTGLYGYYRELVAARRDDLGDDFISTLIRTQAEGETLTEDEMFGALVNFLFAGHDTTRYQLGWAMYLLLANRDQWDRLVADPKLASNAVEEAMRLEPSLDGFVRQVREDVVYRDILFPAGSFIGLSALAANNDPRIFPDPERFDIGRPNASKQLTFGLGLRMCLGNGLARAEMEEALILFASRFPDLAMEGPPQVPAGYTSMKGLEHFPLVLQGSRAVEHA